MSKAFNELEKVCTNSDKFIVIPEDRPYYWGFRRAIVGKKEFPNEEHFREKSARQHELYLMGYADGKASLEDETNT